MKNLIALAVLVVLGIAAFLVMREKPDTEKKKVVAAISPVDTAKLDTIKIKRLEGIKDKAPESYILKKQGETWKMVAPLEFAVVQSTVESMVKVLGELRIIDVISEKPESHEKFEVDDKNGVTVTALQGETPLIELIIGNAKGGITFARLPGKNEVYRLRGSFKYNLDRSIKTLRDKTIVNMEMDDLDQVAFTTREGALTLKKEGEGSDVTVKPMDAKIKNFDAQKATSVVRSAIRLNAVDFVDEKLPPETTGLDDTADTYVVTGKKDDKPYTVTIAVGKKMADKAQVYTKSSESDQIFLISNYTADRLRAKAADFVKEEKKEDKAAGAKPAMPQGMPQGMPMNMPIPMKK